MFSITVFSKFGFPKKNCWGTGLVAQGRSLQGFICVDERTRGINDLRLAKGKGIQIYIIHVIGKCPSNVREQCLAFRVIGPPQAPIFLKLLVFWLGF